MIGSEEEIIEFIGRKVRQLWEEINDGNNDANDIVVDIAILLGVKLTIFCSVARETLNVDPKTIEDGMFFCPECEKVHHV